MKNKRDLFYYQQLLYHERATLTICKIVLPGQSSFYMFVTGVTNTRKLQLYFI
jgi:hypothetical protein